MAFALALGFVAQSASPAAADFIVTPYLYQNSMSAGTGAAGNGYIARTQIGYVDGYTSTNKTEANHYYCAETWLDVKLAAGMHHSPDVYINCNSGSNGAGWYVLHHSGALGPTTDPIGLPQVRTPPTGGMAVCWVDTRTWARSAANCTFTEIDVTGFTSSYSGRTPDDLRWINNWNEPELIAPDRRGLDIRYNGQTLSAGSAIVAWQGRYRASMQDDGNLVVYYAPGNGTQTAVWASNTGGNPGAYARQQTDGNFVIYRANGTCLFHSNTYGQSVTGILISSNGGLYQFKADGTSVTPQWTYC